MAKETSNFISIIIPILNEQENILNLYKEILAVLPNEKIEIIFIDDGSNDNSKSIIKNLTTSDNRVKYIFFSKNFGQQIALKAGYNHAEGDCVISMDGDLQHPPNLIPKMIKEWRAGAMIVAAKRKSTDGLSFFKKNTSLLFYYLLNLISDIKIDSGIADFRLIDKKVVERCRLYNQNNIFWRGLIPSLGFKQTIIEYNQGLRANGQSSYTVLKRIKLGFSAINNLYARQLGWKIYRKLSLQSSYLIDDSSFETTND